MKKWLSCFIVLLGLFTVVHADLLVDFGNNTNYVAANVNNQGRINGWVPFSMTAERQPAAGYTGPVFFGGATGNVTITTWLIANSTPDYLSASSTNPAVGSSVAAVVLFTNQSATITQIVWSVRLGGTATNQTNTVAFVVRKDDGLFYISEKTSLSPSGVRTNSSLGLLAWYKYDPTNSLNDWGTLAGGFTLDGVNAVGEWQDATLKASTTYGVGISAFQAWGTIVASIPPSAAFSAAPTNGYAPLPVSFTDTSTGTITNRFWDFGDGATTNITGTNVTHTYTAGGTTSTVQLVVSGPAGASTNTQVNLITVAFVPPSAAFSASPTNGYAPLPVSFTDNSTGTITNRFWDFGDGATTNTTGTNVTHTYTVGGTTSTVQLVVSGPVGASTNTQINLIIVAAPVPPSAAFSAAPTNGYAPLLVSFTDTSTGAITNRFWDFGDGATTNTTATSVAHTYNVGGTTSTVQLVVSGSSGMSTNTQVNLITVAFVPPSAAFSASPTNGYAPLPVSFTDTSTGTITNRFWDFGDGATTNTTATSVAHTYTVGGTTSTVQLVVSGPAGASTNTQTGLISVLGLPVLPFYDPFGGAATPLNGTNSIPSGWTTADTDPTSFHAYIAANSLSYTGLVASTGNSMGLGNKTADYYLDFSPSNLGTNETIYFSTLLRFNSAPPASMLSGALRLYDSSDAFGSGVEVGFGVTNAGGGLSFSLNNRNSAWSLSTPNTPASYTAVGVTYLIVGSYKRGTTATDGLTQLWIDPDVATFGTATPPAATLVTNTYASDPVWNRLQIISAGSGSWPASWQLDEVRIGTGWADVVPASAVTLTVNSGSGGGVYTNGHVQAIAANVISGKTFSVWTGHTQFVASASSSNTLVTLPAYDITLTATYVDTTYALTVNSGSGSGLYTNGQQVAISANPPVTGMTFDQWTGDTQVVNNVTYTNALVTMSPNPVTLTATYKVLPDFYTLTVNNGSGSGPYTNGQQIAITANAAPTNQVFDQWIGDTQVVNNVTYTNALVTMSTNHVTLTATYKNLPGWYTLTVNSGTGGGTYTNGTQVLITANPPASGMVFDRWTGDTQVVNNITYTNALVTMPTNHVTLTATYKFFPLISYQTNSIVEVTNLLGGAANGRYEPGEVIAVTVSSINNGGLDISNVVNSLFADPAYFTISNLTSSTYLSMPVGASTSTVYRVTILSAATNGTHWFSVTNRSGTMVWPASFAINVFKQGVPSVSPASITMSVLPGAAVTNTQVTVTNSGSAAVTFSITDNGAWGTSYTAVQGSKGSSGWVTANSTVVLNDPNTNSVNIEAATEGVSSAAGIGFSFPFYGTTYSNFYVTADGCIGLMNTTNVPAQSASGVSFPVTNSLPLYAPFRGAPLIAPFWGDLTSPAGSIKTIRSANNYLVISYSVVAKDSGLTNLQFQAALYTNGHMEFRYKTITGVTNTSGLTNVTIGIQGSATSYTNISLVPVNGTSVLLTPQEDHWVSYAPAENVTVAPLSSQVITFIANASGKAAGVSAAFNAWFNWSTGGSNAVSVSANVIAAVPVYSAVSALSFSGAAGQETSAPFIITNTGTGLLNFTISDTNAMTAGYLTTNPVYSWVDISSTGITVPLRDPDPSPYITAADEGSSLMVPLRFAFPFYGSSCTQLSVSVNGAVQLDTTNRVLALVSLGTLNQGVPARLIAPYWGDLILDENSTLKYESAADRFVITWENVRQYGFNGGSNQTFQAVLRPDGVITFQYKKLEGQSWANTTIGLRDTPGRTVNADLRRPGDRIITTNQYGMASTQYVGTVSNRTAQFIPKQIQVIRYTPASGSIAAGGTAEITIIGDASNQSAGTNSASTNATLTITHNASGSPGTLAVTFTATNSQEAVFVRASALADGSIDSDGDGIFDDQERIAGTDPQNADSVFTPQIERGSAGTFLSWPAPLDEMQRIYTVYSKTNLMMSVWEFLYTVTNGTAYLDTEHGNVPVIYYRITVPVQ